MHEEFEGSTYVEVLPIWVPDLRSRSTNGQLFVDALRGGKFRSCLLLPAVLVRHTV